MLTKYLDLIESGKSINFRAYLKHVPERYKATSNYSLEKDGVGSKYYVGFKNQDLFVELRDFANKKKSGGRLVATELGDSHKCKVGSNGFGFRCLKSGEYSLLVLNAIKPVFEPPLAVNNDCVVIENREVFYSEDLMALLAEHQIDGLKCDVLLGNGNEVKNEFLANHLNGRYKNVSCLFDYDLAGLKMYESLIMGLDEPLTTVSFSLPKDMSLCKRPIECEKPSSTDFHEALKLALDLNLIKLHADLFRTSRFMEQEMLLVNMKRAKE